MAHIVHCRICKQDINTDTQTDWLMPSPKWYYHKTCYEDFAKKKGAIKEDGLTIEADDDLWKNATYDYLTKDLKISIDYMKFASQWNNFLKQSMTAKGIYFTLRYFYEVAQGDPKKSENGIGIVKSVYTQGTNYWGERNQRDKGICARIENQITQFHQQEVKVVLQKKKERKRSSIDLASIAEMEDEE